VGRNHRRHALTSAARGDRSHDWVPDTVEVYYWFGSRHYDIDRGLRTVEPNEPNTFRIGQVGWRFLPTGMDDGHPRSLARLPARELANHCRWPAFRQIERIHDMDDGVIK
jgi:hypothetical protein